jgi:hypothetical protein
MPDNGIKVKLRYFLLYLRLCSPCSVFFPSVFFSLICPYFLIPFSTLSRLISTLPSLFFNRFNKPILADIVGDAARNLLQSITDSAGTARMADLGPSLSADSRTLFFFSIYSFFFLISPYFLSPVLFFTSIPIPPF